MLLSRIFLNLSNKYAFFRNVQVSYLIVDAADMDVEMVDDPFLEAGIEVPSALPYQKERQREESSRIIDQGPTRYWSLKLRLCCRDLATTPSALGL